MYFMVKHSFELWWVNDECDYAVKKVKTRKNQLIMIALIPIYMDCLFKSRLDWKASFCFASSEKASF